MTIDEIMRMLDWNNPQTEQEKGIELAKQICCFNVFLQPVLSAYSKNVWDNCAIVIADKTDEELYPYLSSLFEWIQDMNWPGARTIFRRLSQYGDKVAFDRAYSCSYRIARATKDRIWKTNLKDLANCRARMTHKSVDNYISIFNGFVKFLMALFYSEFIISAFVPPEADGMLWIVGLLCVLLYSFLYGFLQWKSREGALKYFLKTQGVFLACSGLSFLNLLTTKISLLPHRELSVADGLTLLLLLVPYGVLVEVLQVSVSVIIALKKKATSNRAKDNSQT
jgi:hypothetical protein